MGTCTYAILTHPRMYVCLFQKFFAPLLVLPATYFFVLLFRVECLNFCIMSNPFEDLHGFVAQNHTKSWEVMKGCHYASLLIGRIAVCFGSKRWYLFFTSRPEWPGMGPFMCIGVLRSHSSPD
jgi:hypothetical protein